MTEKGQNFEIYSGKLYRVLIPVVDENDAPFPLNGYLIRWVVYSPTSLQIVIDKSLGNGITVPTPANGEILIDLLPSDTTNIPIRQYNHQCVIYLDDDNRHLVTIGTVNVLHSIT